MSNTTLLLESLALIKDAYDRLDKADLRGLSATDTYYAEVARLWLASAHRMLEELLHDGTGRKA